MLNSIYMLNSKHLWEKRLDIYDTEYATQLSYYYHQQGVKINLLRKPYNLIYLFYFL